MILNWIALLCMGALASFGSYFLKRASADGLSPTKLIRSRWLYIGGTLYVISAVLNIWLLKRMPYSTVLPLSAMTYIWTLLISHFLLKEEIRTNQFVGVAVILCGVVMIALSL